jgi:hypothetical protein
LNKENEGVNDPNGEPNSKGMEGSSKVQVTTGTPRWVKVFGTILILLIVLFVIMLLAGGPHGPGRHLRPSGSGGQTPNTVPGASQP